MLIPQSKYTGEGVRKRTLARALSIGPMSTKIIGVVLLALLALFIVAQTGQSAARNYKIQDLEDQKSKLDSSKEELTVQATRLKSLQEIKTKSEEMKLESE